MQMIHSEATKGRCIDAKARLGISKLVVMCCVVLLSAARLVAIQPTITILAESSQAWPAGTDFNRFISSSADSLAPFLGQSIHFQGWDFGGRQEQRLGASLVYRARIGFPRPVKLRSVIVRGAAFNASAVDTCDGPIPVSTVLALSDEDELAPASGDLSPDARNLKADGTLRLRAERRADADGRVYLIVAKATDSSGDTGFSTSTVTVALNQSAAAAAKLKAHAADAQAYAAAHNGNPPPGYFVIGNGRLVGRKQ